jgi:hypothetical protein
MNYKIHSEFHRPPVATDSKIIQIGYFQHQNWRNREKVIKELSSLKLISSSSHFLVLRETLLKSSFLAVHMRFGDYEKEPRFGIPNARYFGQAIDQILESSAHDEIVVFTNDSQKALEKMGTHYPLPVKLISNEEILTASETLELMRLAKSYVISNSTFGWWGAFLSHSPKPSVICPRPWFIGLPEPKSMIPENWIEIDGYRDEFLD